MNLHVRGVLDEEPALTTASNAMMATVDCGKAEGGSCLVSPNSLRVSAEAIALAHCDLPFVWNGRSEALGTVVFLMSHASTTSHVLFVLPVAFSCLLSLPGGCPVPMVLPPPLLLVREGNRSVL